MRSHDGEGDFDVQQYEQVDLEIQSLLPKVLCQENPAINAMVAILTTQFKTLPVPNTYTLYHSGICKSIQTLSGVTTSCVSAPATLLLNQYKDIDSDITEDKLESIKENANGVPHYLKVRGLVHGKRHNQPHTPRDNPVVLPESCNKIPATPPGNTTVNMEDLCLPPCLYKMTPSCLVHNTEVTMPLLTWKIWRCPLSL